ncbi:50S ribosomal protein L6 [Candidatus Woesearchaeota archaeon]|nr:50S ribosomal protein L6 [Candidatus Woesearchaeota archaeon]
MKIEKLEETLTLPEGVTATYDAVSRTMMVKGEKGELSRHLYTSGVAIATQNGTITFTAKKATMREKKMLFTFKAHTKNMIKGVTEGYVYKLKVCSGHFPMSVAVKNDTFEIKNFIGEKVPRVLKIKDGAQVKIEAEIITVDGIDKEIVGQVAADIEKLSKRPGFDSRIFQDGIFLIEKAGKTL